MRRYGRPLLLVAILSGAGAVAADEAADREKVAQLRKDIEATRRKLADLESQLAQLEKPQRVDGLSLATMKVGVCGRLGSGKRNGAAVIVERVVDNDSFIARVVYTSGGTINVLMRYPTKDFADNQVKDDLSVMEWAVTGRVMVGSQTMFVLSPATRSRQPEPKK